MKPLAEDVRVCVSISSYWGGSWLFLQALTRCGFTAESRRSEVCPPLNPHSLPLFLSEVLYKFISIYSMVIAGIYLKCLCQETIISWMILLQNMRSLRERLVCVSRGRLFKLSPRCRVVKGVIQELAQALCVTDAERTSRNTNTECDDAGI